MFWAGFKKQALQVYRNVNKGRDQYTYSMKDKGKVVGHTQDLLLQDVSFRVSQKGKDRVRSEKRKNVHAYVKGEPISKKMKGKKFTRITYDPYKHDSFVTQDGLKVTRAKFLKLTPKGIFAHNPS
jgi:hypothetical protein